MNMPVLTVGEQVAIPTKESEKYFNLPSEATGGRINGE
jgi:hypothetical protein